MIFNFSRYEELRQAVLQLVRENLDPDLLYEEAEELFESWWASNASEGHWNDDVKRRIWSSIWSELARGLLRHNDARATVIPSVQRLPGRDDARQTADW